MSVIFSYVQKIFDFNFTSQICYSLSLFLFVSSLTLGCVSLIILGCVNSAKAKSIKWLFYVFQGVYILDICIAVCEYEFFGKYYQNLASVFLSCTIRFGFLLVVYALVCAYKKVINSEIKNEKQELKLLNASLSSDEQKNNLHKLNNVEQIDSFEGLNDFQESPKGDLIDLNVAYIDRIVQLLLSKDLTDDERELCLDITYELRNLPLTIQTERVKKLNEKLQTLTKKAVQYNLAC